MMDGTLGTWHIAEGGGEASEEMEHRGEGQGRAEVEEEQNELQERISRLLDIPLTLLGLLMLALVIVELSADLSPRLLARVAQAQTAIWVVFVAAFLTELALARSKLGYLKGHWLTAISVAFPALRSVRALRVLRVLRGLDLLRLIAALNRGTRAVEHVLERGRAGYVLVLAVLVSVAGAAGAYYFERGAPDAAIVSFGDGLWWALSLLTTVNSPLEVTTFEGRVIGLLLRVFGLALSAYITALAAVYLLGLSRGIVSQEGTEQELRALRSEIGRLQQLMDRGGADARAAASDKEQPAS